MLAALQQFLTPVPRRILNIFSWLCVVLSIATICVLIDSFRNPRAIYHTTRNDMTVFTIIDGCLDYGHIAIDDRKYLKAPPS